MQNFDGEHVILCMKGPHMCKKTKRNVCVYVYTVYVYYVCMNICMYVCIYVCIYMYVYICMYICILGCSKKVEKNRMLLHMLKIILI